MREFKLLGKNDRGFWRVDVLNPDSGLTTKASFVTKKAMEDWVKKEKAKDTESASK